MPGTPDDDNAGSTTKDGIRLHIEEAGKGIPILFIHEFGGNHLSWEPQIQFFARRYRCITYAARGYAPSDIPESIDAYSRAMAVQDAVAVLDGLGIEKAHIVGLSMGGFATVHFGLDAAERARCPRRSPGRAMAARRNSRTISATSRSKSPTISRRRAPGILEDLRARREPRAVPEQGSARLAGVRRPPRDPFGHWRGHDDAGRAGPSPFVLRSGRPELKVMELPTLVVVGDEDDHCLQPGIFLKKTIPPAASPFSRRPGTR